MRKGWIRRTGWIHWVWTGLLLLLIQLALVQISPQFDYSFRNITKPILWQVGLQVAAGGIYLYALLVPTMRHASRRVFYWMIAVGLLLRLVLFASTPILEDDFYRYLWDGGLTAHGHNPYATSPAQAQEGVIPDSIATLATEAGTVLDRVNHPSLRTIYPPTAQFAFALAHRIRPWSLNAWRLVLLGCDALTLLLLVLLLRQLGLWTGWIVVYWWNPLVTMQLFNTAHMDGVIAPFLLLALLLGIRRSPVWAAVALGIAVGAKVWPLLLLPVLLRPYLGEWRRLTRALLAFAMVTSLMALPVLLAGLDSKSGFTAYSQYWEMNDALYMLFLWGFQGLLRLLPAIPFSAHTLTRFFTMMLLGTLLLWQNRSLPTGSRDLLHRATWISAMLFLLIPTQFPWYFVWVMPFLVLGFRPSLLLLTMLLPLYYLRFYLAVRGHTAWFDYGVVWVEYVPVWIGLVWEWYQRRRDVLPERVSQQWSIR